MVVNQALSSDQVYYSQHGEDFLLRNLFSKQNKGFFVEIGCIDGRRFSNSLHFENNGWTGLCVEAHSDYIKLLERNRPNSIVECAAVGEKDIEEVEFYANSRGSLSTLDKSKEGEFKKDYGKFFTGFEVQIVPMLTLNTIFKKYDVEVIDFLSLDIEGYEVQALKGIDLEVYRPKVFVIESDSEMHKKMIDSILLPAGYYFIASIEQNLFYSLEKNHQRIIGNKIFNSVHLLHTQHPLDSSGDAHMMVNVSTSEANNPDELTSRHNRILTIVTKYLNKINPNRLLRR